MNSFAHRHISVRTDFSGEAPSSGTVYTDRDPAMRATKSDIAKDCELKIARLVDVDMAQQ